MEIAIMQPYFFPYIGYWQLLDAVDTFVIYDDVNFIKQGWIARNRILINGREHMISLQLKGAGSFVLIKDIRVGDNRDKLFMTIRQAYAKAPYLKDFLPTLEHILLFRESCLSLYLKMQLESICKYLDIETNILLSSEVTKPSGLAGVDNVISICKVLKADVYVNAIGGQDLYKAPLFYNRGLDLRFLQPIETQYHQLSNRWIPWLSIIDVLMNNSQPSSRTILSKYTLL